MLEETQFNKAVKHMIDNLENVIDDDVREMALDAIGVLNLKPQVDGLDDLSELTQKAILSPEVQRSLENLVGILVSHLNGCLEFMFDDE